MIKSSNIFSNIPEDMSNELFENILKTKHLKIERIVSKGHSSPENFWYDQDKDEWVILLKGSASILFQDNEIMELKPGDYINIPAHVKHRVEQTAGDQESVWLAVHYSEDG